jgi:DNA-binding NarL/FixJ family response regulator
MNSVVAGMSDTVSVPDVVLFDSALPQPARRKRVVPPGIRFSPRERQLVSLVAGGYSNKEIAGYLNLQLQTVKNHLSRVYRKLGISRRVELAVFAVGYGLVDSD